MLILLACTLPSNSGKSLGATLIAVKSESYRYRMLNFNVTEGRMGEYVETASRKAVNDFCPSPVFFRNVINNLSNASREIP